MGKSRTKTNRSEPGDIPRYQPGWYDSLYDTATLAHWIANAKAIKGYAATGQSERWAAMLKHKMDK